jgi:cell division protein FtsX
MHLVGSSDKFIRTPLILEGTMYGFIGGLISAMLILIPWYTIMSYTQGTDFGYWTAQMFSDFNMPFLIQFNLLFVLVFTLIHILIGSILGLLSSYSAVKKYLSE